VKWCAQKKQWVEEGEKNRDFGTNKARMNKALEKRTQKKKTGRDKDIVTTANAAFERH